MWPTHYIPHQARINSTPPPRIYLTSCPYPYELQEELTSSGSFVSAQPGEQVSDEMTSSGSFHSGVLNSFGIQGYEWQENLFSNGSFVSGALVQRLRTIDAGIDGLEVSGSFVSGVVTDPLIYYLNWPLQPDQLQSSGSFVSGVLT